MKSEMPHDNRLEISAEAREELAIAYVLEELDEAGRREVEARVAGGDLALAGEIAQVQEGLACLALNLPPVEPPPEVRERLFASLESLEAVPEVSGANAAEVQANPVLAGLNEKMDVDSDLQKLSIMLQQFNRRAPAPAEPSTPARKAVLVIDMLHDYVDEGAPMEVPAAREIVPSIQRLLERERQRGTPIIYVNDLHTPDDPDFEVWPVHAVHGTAGAAVLPPLRPAAGDLQIERVSYSAFFETELEPLLSRMGVTDLVLTGQAADACVMMTAIDALMRGYRVEVPPECVAGTTEEGKIFALRRIALLKPYQAKRRR